VEGRERGPFQDQSVDSPVGKRAESPGGATEEKLIQVPGAAIDTLEARELRFVDAARAEALVEER
jgi:hypothetical protein